MIGHPNSQEKPGDERNRHRNTGTSRSPIFPSPITDAEIRLAEHEMPGLMATRRELPLEAAGGSPDHRLAP